MSLLHSCERFKFRYASGPTRAHLLISLQEIQWQRPVIPLSSAYIYKIKEIFLGLFFTLHRYEYESSLCCFSKVVTFRYLFLSRFTWF